MAAGMLRKSSNGSSTKPRSQHAFQGSGGNYQSSGQCHDSKPLGPQQRLEIKERLNSDFDLFVDQSNFPGHKLPLQEDNAEVKHVQTVGGVDVDQTEGIARQRKITTSTSTSRKRLSEIHNESRRPNPHKQSASDSVGAMMQPSKKAKVETTFESPKGARSVPDPATSQAPPPSQQSGTVQLRDSQQALRDSADVLQRVQRLSSLQQQQHNPGHPSSDVASTTAANTPFKVRQDMFMFLLPQTETSSVKTGTAGDILEPDTVSPIQPTSNAKHALPNSDQGPSSNESTQSSNLTSAAPSSIQPLATPSNFHFPSMQPLTPSSPPKPILDPFNPPQGHPPARRYSLPPIYEPYVRRGARLMGHWQAEAGAQESHILLADYYLPRTSDPLVVSHTTRECQTEQKGWENVWDCCECQVKYPAMPIYHINGCLDVRKWTACRLCGHEPCGFCVQYNAYLSLTTFSDGEQKNTVSREDTKPYGCAPWHAGWV